jgi:hypothetical protein
MHHAPWNKGRLTAQKRPLRQKDVWAMRVVSSSIIELATLRCAADQAKLAGQHHKRGRLQRFHRGPANDRNRRFLGISKRRRQGRLATPPGGSPGRAERRV